MEGDHIAGAKQHSITARGCQRAMGTLDPGVQIGCDADLGRA